MNQQHFLKIIQPFQDKLYRLAKRLLVSKEEAEDATQEVLLKLWKNNKKISSYKNIEAFAMTMIKNYCYDKLKAKSSNHLKIVHSNYKDRLAEDVSERIENDENARLIERLIQELSEQQRIIIQLREIEGYEYESIARLLEMKETAVRVSLSRARKILKQKLTQSLNYDAK